MWRQRFWRIGWATVTLLACLDGIAAAQVANPDQQVSAEIYAPTGQPTQDVVAIANLDGGCPAYTGPNIQMYLADGAQGPGQAVGADAWTLGQLLSCLTTPISLSSVTGITVIGPEGPQLEANAAITPGDLNPSESDFADPQEYPLIFSNGDGITYDRPWRGGSDDNSADNFTVDSPTPFRFEVFEGATFTVNVSASTQSVGAGAPLSFRASAPEATGQLTYSWSFDGGASAQTAADPTVTFANPGVYDVTVQVIDGGGGVGIGTDQVTVGAATPTTASAHPRPTGPAHSGGHSPGAAARKHSGASVTTEQIGHTRDRSQAHQKATAKSSPKPSLTNSGPAPRPNSTTHVPASTRSPAAPTPTRTQPADTRASAHPSTPTATDPPAQLVDGRALGGLDPQPAAGSPLVRELEAASAAAPALSRQTGSPPLLGGAAALVVILLLGFGAWRELHRGGDLPSTGSRA